MKKHGKDMEIHSLIPVPSNNNHLIVMDTESRGTVWDLKAKKILRHLPTFSGMCTTDGKLGLHAPSKGGLHVNRGHEDGRDLEDTREFPLQLLTPSFSVWVGQVAEGVNDVQARFTGSDLHALYYHSGQQTLRAFRVADGKLIGTFRPHARITTWASDASGQKIVIGGQDGSLLTAFLYDESTHSDAQQALAVLPSRRFLAEHLGIAVNEEETEANVDVRNLTIVSKAVQKFKGLTVAKQQNSAVCSIQ
ncbi:Leucine-rich repeat and WD repeat-containing protein [Aphelenchoides fujianensis]|nr:Leucine-rich repeat and WD repeat-containing protein [Aphelenchoides fujianensis]